MRQNLSRTLLSAIEKAKKSIHLVTYGLSDKKILSTLKKKDLPPKDMKIFYDKRASSPICLPNHNAYAVAQKGLTHQKILVIDRKKTFLGSANFTSSSLVVHENFILGLYSKELASFLMQKTPFYPGYFHTEIDHHSIDLYLLPDKKNEALPALTQELRQAKKSLDIALFTLTHPAIVDEIILAKERKVQVRVFIDRRARLGASAKAIEKLLEHHIPVFVNQKFSLFHHKMAFIDKNTLIIGSANWTLSAFKKNSDCLLFLRNLTKEETRYLEKLLYRTKCQCRKEEN